MVSSTQRSFRSKSDSIEAAVVAVARLKEALRRPRVSPLSERSDECCEVMAKMMEGDAMIAVPSITNCLARAFRHSSRQAKWRFGWECLRLQCLFRGDRSTVNSAVCAVVLPRYYHAVAPRHWLTVGDPFDDPGASSRLRSDSTCSCQCIGTGAAVCTAMGITPSSRWISTGGPVMHGSGRCG